MIRKKKIKQKLIVFALLCLFIMFIYNNISKTISDIGIEKSLNNLIEKVDYMKQSEYNEGTTYYIASNGTSYTGTDINDPMSLSIAFNKTFHGNDKVLLKRGDVFYGVINFNVLADKDNMFYIGAYGDESLPNPIITTSYYIKNSDAWKKEENGIYSIDLSQHSNFEGYFTNSDWSYDIGFFRDDKNNLYGSKKESKEELLNKYDFFCEKTSLFIKSEVNPSDELGRITLANKINIVGMNSNTIIDGITIKDTGAHGMGKKDSFIENTIITNCIIENIGGSYLNDEGVRYGNGIEFWHQAKNTVVRNCIFKNIFDAAYTLQGDEVKEGFYNNLCENNIFINCTYPIEMFCYYGDLKIDNCKFERNIVRNNIIINQGHGFGFDNRPDKFQPSNLVVWILPYPNVKVNYSNNRTYNSRSLFYQGFNAQEDLYEKCVNADNNFYYMNSNAYTFIDDVQHNDISYLQEKGLDTKSTFNYLTDEEIEIISNPEILNSDDYNEIKEYYDNFDKKYNIKNVANNLINSVDSVMNSDKYINLLNNESINDSYLSLRETIHYLSNSIDIINKNSVSYSYECLYDLMKIVSNEYYNNNLSNEVNEAYLGDLIKDLDSLSSEYKELYSYYVTEDNIDVSTVKNALNNTIDKYNNNLNLNIGYLENIISTAKKIYNNYLMTDNVYENVFNKERITYITNVVNNVLDIQINKIVESEQAKIKVTFDKDINQPTSENITATLNLGNETKITNNNGSNKHTFYENGTFTFNLEIRGVKFTLDITINNISKNYIIKDGYIDNITKNTLANTLKNELNISNYTIKRNGRNINLDIENIATGDILKYNNQEYILIVTGDINGDGDCGIYDLVSLRKYLLDYITYDNVETKAADTNQDNVLNIEDLVSIRKNILNFNL